MHEKKRIRVCQEALTRAALGSPAERAALAGVVNFTFPSPPPPPPLLTRKPAAVASWAWRQLKALNEYLSREF